MKSKMSMCRECGTDISDRDYRARWCALCAKDRKHARERKSRERNPEKVRERVRKYYQANRKKELERSRKWREAIRKKDP